MQRLINALDGENNMGIDFDARVWYVNHTPKTNM